MDGVIEKAMVSIMANTHTQHVTLLMVQSFWKALGGAQIQPQCSIKVLFTPKGKRRVVTVHHSLCVCATMAQGHSTLVCLVGEQPILTERAQTQSCQFEKKKN